MYSIYSYEYNEFVSQSQQNINVLLYHIRGLTEVLGAVHWYSVDCDCDVKSEAHQSKYCERK